MGTGPSCTVDAAQSYMRTFTPTQEENIFIPVCEKWSKDGNG